MVAQPRPGGHGTHIRQIERVTIIMCDIVGSSREQASGISQVTGTVSQMDQAIQQNAGLVEDAAAAANVLQSEAARLKELMAVFRVADGGSAAAARPRPRARQQSGRSLCKAA
jgi:class 3 adenylate cyclase